MASCEDAPEKRAARAPSSDEAAWVVDHEAARAPSSDEAARVVDYGDLIIEPGARGPDRVRGLGSVHHIVWGDKVGPPERTSCQQAHEIRVGKVAFPRAEYCTTWGRFDAFTASARGIEIDDAYAVVAQLTALLGSDIAWEDRGDLYWSWKGELVEIRLEWTWWKRLRLSGELDNDYAMRVFTEGSGPEARRYGRDGIVRQTTVMCRVEGVDVETAGHVWYTAAEPARPVTFGPGTVRIPAREGSASAYLIVEGFVPAAIEWDPAPGRSLLRCSNRSVRLDPMR